MHERPRDGQHMFRCRVIVTLDLGNNKKEDKVSLHQSLLLSSLCKQFHFLLLFVVFDISYWFKSDSPSLTMNDARHVAAVTALHGLNPTLPLYRVMAPEYRFRSLTSPLRLLSPPLLPLPLYLLENTGTLLSLSSADTYIIRQGSVVQTHRAIQTATGGGEENGRTRGVVQAKRDRKATESTQAQASSRADLHE